MGLKLDLIYFLVQDNITCTVQFSLRLVNVINELVIYELNVS